MIAYALRQNFEYLLQIVLEGRALFFKYIGHHYAKRFKRIANTVCMHYNLPRLAEIMLWYCYVNYNLVNNWSALGQLQFRILLSELLGHESTHS